MKKYRTSLGPWTAIKSFFSQTFLSLWFREPVYWRWGRFFYSKNCAFFFHGPGFPTIHRYMGRRILWLRKTSDRRNVDGILIPHHTGALCQPQQGLPPPAPFHTAVWGRPGLTRGPCHQTIPKQDFPRGLHDIRQEIIISPEDRSSIKYLQLFGGWGKSWREWRDSLERTLTPPMVGLNEEWTKRGQWLRKPLRKDHITAACLKSSKVWSVVCWMNGEKKMLHRRLLVQDGRLSIFCLSQSLNPTKIRVN